MNNIRSINQINEKELDLALEGASWHDEYKDSAYIFVGGLPLALTEGDVLTIFSQYGEILDVHLPRAKETGAKRGFGFLMFEDQRSTVLAVDNLNGAVVLDRTLRVDHVREYRQPGERDAEGKHTEAAEPSRNAAPVLFDAESGPSSMAIQQPPNADLDLEDPMANYIAANRSHVDPHKHSKEDDAAKAERKAERARVRQERVRKRARSGSAKESREGTSHRSDRRRYEGNHASKAPRDQPSRFEERDRGHSRHRSRSRSPWRDYSPRRERR